LVMPESFSVSVANPDLRVFITFQPQIVSSAQTASLLVRNNWMTSASMAESVAAGNRMGRGRARPVWITKFTLKASESSLDVVDAQQKRRRDTAAPDRHAPRSDGKIAA
jgi:hypothetical protein